MPLLMGFALEHEIITFAWIDNAFVQFPFNFYATKWITRKDSASPEPSAERPSPFPHAKSNWNEPPPGSATLAGSIPRRVGRAVGRGPCLCPPNRNHGLLWNRR